MSVTSGIKMLMKEEATYGTAPGGAMSEVRMTSEDLSPNLEYTESAAIRSDGQITDMIRTDAMGGGTVNGELCYDANVFDELAQSAMVSEDWNTVSAVTGAGISMTAATSTVPTILADSGSGFGSITEGMWVKVSGFSNTANNQLFKVVNATSAQLHLRGNTAADEASGASVTVTPLAHICNGKTVKTFTFEREDTSDASSNEFHLYTGMSVNSLEMTVPTTGIITYSFGLEGKKPTSETSTSSGGSDNAQTTNSPMAAADVVQFWEGDTLIGSISGATHGSTHEWEENPFQLLDFSLSITPNLRQRKTIGNIGPSSAPGRGDIGVTGSFRCYYNSDADGAEATRTNSALIDKGLNDTQTSLAIFVKDAAGNGYVFDLPRVQFTSVSRTTPGKSEDVIAEVEFQAYRNDLEVNYNTGVSGTTIQIARGTSL